MVSGFKKLRTAQHSSGVSDAAQGTWRFGEIKTRAPFNRINMKNIVKYGYCAQGTGIVSYLFNSKLCLAHKPINPVPRLGKSALCAYGHHRVADFPTICDLHDEAVCILTIEAGNRYEV